MSEEIRNDETISIGSAVSSILLGAIVGASLDALMPSETDGTLANTIIEAAFGGLGAGIGSKFIGKSTTYAAKEAGLFAFGSAVGQTIYNYLRAY